MTNKPKRRYSLMSNSITQKMKYKQSVIKFSFKYGVRKTAIRFDINTRTIYRWIKQYIAGKKDTMVHWKV